MYIYKTVLYKTTDNVIGVNVSQNNTDKADFENNHKAGATEIDEILIEETSFIFNLTYSQFEGKVATPLTWADVKFIDNASRYELHLVSETPL
jgi:hypothetical protein